MLPCYYEISYIRKTPWTEDSHSGTMRFSKEIVRFSKQISLKDLSRLIFFILKDFWFATIVIGLVVADSQLSLHKNQRQTSNVCHLSGLALTFPMPQYKY